MKHLHFFIKIIFIFFCFFISANITKASFDDGLIDSTYWKALETSAGTRINAGHFTSTGIDTYNVHITDNGLSGMMFGESLGWIRLNCAAVGTLASGCADSNYHVDLDATSDLSYGVLSGFAWGEKTGWVSFNCSNPTNAYPSGSCADADFSVRINSLGEFTGYAWSENYGYIKFDCTDADSCVKTDWVPKVSRPACADGIDNNADGFTDSADRDCHTDCISANNASYNKNGTVEFGICSTAPPPPAIKPTPTPTPVTPEPVPVVPPSSNIEPTIPSPVLEPPSVSVSVGGGESGFGGSGSSGSSGSVGSAGGHSVDGGCNSVWCYVTENVGNSINSSAQVIDVTKKAVKVIFENPKVEPVAKAAGVVGVVAGSSVSIMSLLFVNPLSLGELLLIPFRLWSLFLVLIGLKKRNRPWGTVYDSVTKQPLDPVYVSVFDTSGKEVETSITDIDGRFGFLLPPGTYNVVAHKTNYIFPSKLLDGKYEDEMYKDLYYGMPFTVGTDNNNLVISNIPMDPEHFDWNEYAKRQQTLMKYHKTHELFWVRLANVFFFVGYIVSILSWYTKASTYNMVVVALYTLMLILKYTALRPKPRSYVVSPKGNPYPYAIVHILRNDKDFMKKITNKNGQFYCLIPNGVYEVNIEKKNLDGSYSPVMVKHTVVVKKGYMDEKFIIEQNYETSTQGVPLA
ncbi:MAG: carboxypeptidase-like regulatory domain-containing protein [Minisyncoccia bacterium]